MGPHKSWVERYNHLPLPAGLSSFIAAQSTVGFPGCRHKLLAHVQLLLYQDPQVLLHRAVLKEIFPNLYKYLGLPDPSAAQCTWPYWTSSGFHGPTSPACSGPSVWLPFLPRYQLHCSAFLSCVMHKLAEGALDAIVYVIDRDVEEHQFQDRPSSDTAYDQLPPWQSHWSQPFRCMQSDNS